ncbi:MAG TPA: Xaa-Pro dipeptidase [Steroidobacteraceae bacterium]|nr:Xaa-Pro dipeptidase [Steroidobacteraceae bacterium]
MATDLDANFPAHLGVIRARADAALAAAGFDGLAIYSGRPRNHFLDDHGPPFKPNPHFLHWAPLLDAPESFLLYTPGNRPHLLFHQPADYWYSPPVLPSEPWTQQFDIEVMRDPAEALRLLPVGARLAFIGEPQEEFAGWGFAAVNPPALLAHLHFHRAVKTAYEVECMRGASLIGARAHLAAEAAYRSGASEYEVHQAYCSASGLREQELPYGNIVAFGTGAAVLHYQNPTRSRERPRPSFLIDAGAAVRGYASDITRTYSGGDAEFAALIAAMDRAQQQLCAAIRPGTDYREVHLLAHWLIAGVLREAGIVGCDQEGAVATGVTRVFFPHGIGHLLGLQVHDVAGLARDTSGAEIPRPEGHPFLRLTRTLEPGFTVTVEPGLYFIDLLLEQARGAEAGRHIRWDAVERLRPYGGVRIEDDVHCTAGEPENLTRAAFAALGRA